MQQVIIWESYQVSLEVKLKELISKGYRVVNVIPTSYSDYNRLLKAIIIVDEGRKEKLEKINEINEN